MKIKNLLLMGLCTLTMTSFAVDQGTVMFYENFGYLGWHDGSDASTAGKDRLIAN